MTTGELWQVCFHGPGETLAIFCAPVMGVREAVVVAIVGVVLFGGTLMTILRRIRVMDEKYRFPRTNDAKLRSSTKTNSAPGGPSPDDPTQH